jgi:hypothetical protein
MTLKKRKAGVAILNSAGTLGSAHTGSEESKSGYDTHCAKKQEIMEKMDATIIGNLAVDWNWFCDNAELFNKVDWKRSYEISGLNDCMPKECYYNAWKCDVGGRYDYYEGVSRDPNLPVLIAHSWLVDKNTGEVIDPTFVIHKEERKDLEWIGVKIDRQWLNMTCMKFKRTGDFIKQWSERK